MSAVRDLVLVDTGIWAAFFSRPASSEKREIDTLLDDRPSRIDGMYDAAVVASGIQKI